MRGAPQVGFSITIRKIRSRTSLEIRPPAGHSPCLGDHTANTIANPDPCHRTTVSGVTTISACFHPDQNLRAKTQKSLSNTASLGLGCFRFSAASCWRRARFSRRSLATTLEESEDRTHQEYNRVYHVRVLSRFACEWQCRILLKSQADRILANDRVKIAYYVLTTSVKAHLIAIDRDSLRPDNRNQIPQRRLFLERPPGPSRMNGAGEV